MNKIWNRLLLTAEMVIPGKPVADIGADHAQLALYLAGTGQVPKVIVGELGDGPFQRACSAVRQGGCLEKIELRQGNGLEVLDFHEVSTVVLAGMGGDTIVEILSRNWDKAGSFQRFVLQPMSKIQVIRQRLASRGWIIEAEALAEERNRLFVVMAIRPGNIPYSLNDLELDIGPLLIKDRNALSKLYIERRLDQCRRVFKEVSDPGKNRPHFLADYFLNKINGLEELLNGYQS